MKISLLLLLLGSFASCSAKEQPQSIINDTIMQKQNIIELVKENNIDGVEKALNKGVNVNTQDKNKRSLLLLATLGKHIKMATLLTEKGADVNLQDNMQDSPFLYAGASGQTQLVQLFLANGARFDVFNRYNGSALIPACERGHVETVRLLATTRNYPINHINRLGWTGLMEAIVLGDGGEKYQQVVQILKDAGADITIPDKDGITPLQHAQSRGFTAIVKILSSF